MVWYLFLLVVVFVTAVFVWDFRRKAARRKAASQERFEQIFKAKAASATTPETSPATVPSTGAAAAPNPAAVAAAFPARERFLGQPKTLAYLLLKTGIPDHHVFANVTLASVVSVPGAGFDREQQVRRLSQYRLDLVVCGRGMRIVAVVDLETPGGVDAEATLRYKSDCLAAAGIRFIRINPKSLPSREGIRDLVCGGPDTPGK